MNRPWEDLLYPGTLTATSNLNDTLCHAGPGQTKLGGLSKGFRSDFWLRGYKMIDQMTGKISFVQGLFLALTGRLANCREDRLLNSMFINNGLTDPRFWLFRTARLSATVKSSPTASLAAGLLVNDGVFLGSGAAYHTSLFLYETEKELKKRQADLSVLIQKKLNSDLIIGGFGRVLARGPDERNTALMQVAKECELADGEYLALAFAIEKKLQKLKNSDLYMNSAGLCCSLLLDMGMLPHQIMIFCAQLFLIGMSGNIVEAYERPPGEFSSLSPKDVNYTGPKRKKLPRQHAPQQTVVEENNEVRIVVMDSVSYLTKENQDDIVICGSHGGIPAAQYARKYSPRAIVFNDAGRGKNDAGVAGLFFLQKTNIAALAVEVTSAEIGDGMDTYHNGIISVANAIASDVGVAEGMTVRKAVQCLIEEKKSQNIYAD